MDKKKKVRIKEVRDAALGEESALNPAILYQLGR